MAVVDANYKFLVVDIGAYGKGYDSLVFQDSKDKSRPVLKYKNQF